MQYENLSQELVDRCLSRGADSAEVLIEEGRQLSIEVRNGEMETIQESSSHGAGFRVFREGKMGFAHSNDLSDASLDKAIESAVNFAQHMTADEHNILPGDPGVTAVEGLFDPDHGRRVHGRQDRHDHRAGAARHGRLPRHGEQRIEVRGGGGIGVPGQLQRPGQELSVRRLQLRGERGGREG